MLFTIFINVDTKLNNVVVFSNISWRYYFIYITYYYSKFKIDLELISLIYLEFESYQFNIWFVCLYCTAYHKRYPTKWQNVMSQNVIAQNSPTRRMRLLAENRENSRARNFLCMWYKNPGYTTACVPFLCVYECEVGFSVFSLVQLSVRFSEIVVVVFFHWDLHSARYGCFPCLFYFFIFVHPCF